MDAEILAAAESFRQRHSVRAPRPRHVMERVSPGDCPVNPQPLMPCAKYRITVTSAICRRCASDPALKQALFLDYVRNRAARAAACFHRGPLLGNTDAPCCYGKRKIKIGEYLCSQSGVRVKDPDCWLCSSYQP